MLNSLVSCKVWFLLSWLREADNCIFSLPEMCLNYQMFPFVFSWAHEVPSPDLLGLLCPAKPCVVLVLHVSAGIKTTFGNRGRRESWDEKCITVSEPGARAGQDPHGHQDGAGKVQRHRRGGPRRRCTPGDGLSQSGCHFASLKQSDVSGTAPWGQGLGRDFCWRLTLRWSPSCMAQAEKWFGPRSVAAQAVLEGKVALLHETKHDLVLRTNPIPQMLPAWSLNGF